MQSDVEVWFFGAPGKKMRGGELDPYADMFVPTAPVPSPASVPTMHNQELLWFYGGRLGDLLNIDDDSTFGTGVELPYDIIERIDKDADEVEKEKEMQEFLTNLEGRLEGVTNYQDKANIVFKFWNKGVEGLDKNLADRKSIIIRLEKASNILKDKSLFKFIINQFFFISFEYDVCVSHSEEPDWRFMLFLKKRYGYDFVFPIWALWFLEKLPLDRVKTILQHEALANVKINTANFTAEDINEYLDRDREGELLNIYKVVSERFPITKPGG